MTDHDTAAVLTEAECPVSGRRLTTIPGVVTVWCCAADDPCAECACDSEDCLCPKPTMRLAAQPPQDDPQPDERDDLVRVLKSAQMQPYEDGKGGWLFKSASAAELADAVLAAGWRRGAGDE